MEKTARERIIALALLVVFAALIVRTRAGQKQAPALPQIISSGETIPMQPKAAEVTSPSEAVVEYKPASAKDPFRSPLADKPLRDAGKKEEVVVLPAMKLKGIIWNVKEPQAVINDKVVKIGDNIEDAQITAIEKGLVRLRYKEKDFTLVLSDAIAERK